jgi:hypothetical protein
MPNAPQCERCFTVLQRDILFGGLRFYVCHGCGAWAVPYPPGGEPDYLITGEHDDQSHRHLLRAS